MHVVGGEDDTHDFGQRLAATFGDVVGIVGVVDFAHLKCAQPVMSQRDLQDCLECADAIDPGRGRKWITKIEPRALTALDLLEPGGLFSSATC
jgi:hypothetical protein